MYVLIYITNVKNVSMCVSHCILHIHNLRKCKMYHHSGSLIIMQRKQVPGLLPCYDYSCNRNVKKLNQYA